MAESMIFPSKAEGFSLVIIEAMASGIPVIIKEELEFKLSNECLKYKNTNTFEKIINNQILKKEEQSKLSKKAREVTLNSYSWDIVSKEYLNNK